MAITYPLAMPAAPAGNMKAIQLFADSVTAMVESPYTKSQQVQEYAGELWGASVSLPPLKARADAEAWITFLLKLRGRSGTFLLGDPAGTAPQGVATGTPVVDGGAQLAGGKLLATRGWTPSITNILKAGDYIQVIANSNQRLYKNLTDANSDGAGKVTLDIFPVLRESPADAATLTLANAKGTFRLAANRRTWTYDEQLMWGIAFQAMEAI